ncbi:hypothetical protein A2673_02380 [Candidatus Kaiserbacteria bacterium RIFCSPHIGHO2_01_FULL_50_13]|uniref:Uncharacterized protein n=1 Tax=Candidatus Kaiserbacteria bacterium RIFCSPLOWO2_01_FULL_50_24 TaxID=1798507 RepID=A0A1F6EQW4_9BACT|nr:MAG: hypothetical protein A2673_02380 [Candidatus Kaiserbacteria bacterium RIFCSPHIGHO2_01_FULL_50_13]OGG76027.1 MAG: hypothetical protein A3A34_00035 [Candidatus Kaiserbacteria bacterium RIFCSPLOWO2_01_FULL_50_24]
MGIAYWRRKQKQSFPAALVRKRKNSFFRFAHSLADKQSFPAALVRKRKNSFFRFAHSLAGRSSATKM